MMMDIDIDREKNEEDDANEKTKKEEKKNWIVRVLSTFCCFTFQLIFEFFPFTLDYYWGKVSSIFTFYLCMCVNCFVRLYGLQLIRIYGAVYIRYGPSLLTAFIFFSSLVFWMMENPFQGYLPALFYYIHSSWPKTLKFAFCTIRFASSVHLYAEKMGDEKWPYLPPYHTCHIIDSHILEWVDERNRLWILIELWKLTRLRWFSSRLLSSITHSVKTTLEIV